MNYVCTKPVKLGGTEFFPGDAIPEELFAKGRASKLISYGYIAESAADGVAVSPVNTGVPASLSILIPGTDGSEDEAISINAEQLQNAVAVMRGSASAAVVAIGEEVDDIALRFVAAVDSRKDVKKAAQKQLTVLSSLKSAE